MVHLFMARIILRFLSHGSEDFSDQPQKKKKKKRDFRYFYTTTKTIRLIKCQSLLKASEQ